MDNKDERVLQFLERILAKEPTTEELKDFLLQRIGFMQEELSELAMAAAAEDAYGVLDALVDLDYFARGTKLLLCLGEAFDKAFTNVHNANMRKVPGLSKRGPDAIKDASFVEPEEVDIPFESPLRGWVDENA